MSLLDWSSRLYTSRYPNCTSIFRMWICLTWVAGNQLSAVSCFQVITSTSRCFGLNRYYETKGTQKTNGWVSILQHKYCSATLFCFSSRGFSSALSLPEIGSEHCNLPPAVFSGSWNHNCLWCMGTNQVNSPWCVARHVSTGGGDSGCTLFISFWGFFSFINNSVAALTWISYV